MSRPDGSAVVSSRDGSIAVITIDNPPVNALSSAVAEDLARHVQIAGTEPSITAIVLIGAGNTFIAGADIRELARIASGQQGPLRLLSSLQVIEDSPKPVIAAIHGAALGGGLEAALAAHYRLITADGKVGFPEVKLGLIPGAGGTQRLPRLVGLSTAARLCASGEPVNAQEALSVGLVDRIVGSDLLLSAIEFAREASGKAFQKTSDRKVMADAEPQMMRTVRGLQAPGRAIEAVSASTALPFADGCRRESELFAESLRSSESKALIYGFFAERTVGKVPGLPKPQPLERVAVIGAGTMGAAIATVFADAGLPVVVKETSADALERGMATIRGQYERAVAKGRLSLDGSRQSLSRIRPQLDWDTCENVDLFVEAAFEDLSVKRTIFAELDSIARQGCILASNTSSLDLDEIAQATKRPEAVVGLHFFSPANIMRLLEVIRGANTSDAVIGTVLALGKRLGKVAVLARNGPGFIGNRVFFPYLRQARLLAEEGVSVEQVNNALYDWGMAMGPLAVDDLTGLDVSLQIENQLNQPGIRRPVLTEALVKSGRLGRKNGRGWSKYDEAGVASPDPAVAALIGQLAGERRSVQPEEIVERCIYAMINEGARVLEEGIASRPEDIDITLLKGFGFPAWRGGPMFYADTVGLAKVVEGVSRIAEPANLLRCLAESEKTFHSLSQSSRS